MESLDGWVYFASLQMDRVSLLVLNLQTLESTITTIPVEVSGFDLTTRRVSLTNTGRHHSPVKQNYHATSTPLSPTVLTNSCWVMRTTRRWTYNFSI